MLAKRAGDLLHGLDAGTHGLAAPIVEKSAGPGGRVVLPELLEGLLEKVSPDGLQVIPKQVEQAEALRLFQILFAFEQEPSRLRSTTTGP
jgi:hypothetical protein